ncbi:hypothetical protein B7463_g9540, partial [Scytalidium lignicola]
MSGVLAGKTAVITGASKGIGRACALALGKKGANVVVNYLSNAKMAEDVVNEIGASRAITIKADVSTLSGIKELVSQTVSRFNKIDILLLNAGLLVQNGSLEDTEEEQFDRLYATNVKGPYFLVKEAVKHIPEGGRIIFFSTSITALSTVTPNYLLYTSTKGAIEQMSRILAKDLGRRQITVNTISPGPTGTDGFYEGKNEAVLKMISSWNPLNRIGTVEEIANVITFIASPDSSWLNGQNVRVNGGMTVG